MIRDFNDNWQFSSDDGTTWTEVTLPHDAQMTLPRSADAAGGSATGFFPGGSFRYRKRFSLAEDEAAGHVTFQFGGVYKNAKVILNGQDAGGCAYGYRSFSIAADDLVKAGDNAIEVTCGNAEQPDSRWYSGAGIYRTVTMQLQGKTRIVPGSVRVRTVSIDREKNSAVLDVEAKTEPEEAVKKLAISAVPQDKKDGQAAQKESASGIERGDGHAAFAGIGTGKLTVSNARLWSADHPNLYRIIISLPNEDGSEADRYELDYGIRQVEKRADGLYVNGEKTYLRGGCIHSDNGVLGAREYKESAYRRIRLLKQYGFNAIRSAHNPASTELLDACDHLGMYVMDEMWDMWYRKKNPYDYANEFSDHYRDDIAATVNKDYNHPSVILYSIGNEVSEPAEEKGVRLGREMVDLFHQLDPTRLVTAGINLMIVSQSARGKGIYSDDGGRRDDGSDQKMSGMNSTMFNMIASMVGPGMNKAANGKKADAVTTPILDALDVAGYNYASGRYKKDAKLHPHRIIFGSETFPQDLAKNWAMVRTLPNLIGDFMWTAWDYLGEAGIGAWSTSPDAKGFSKSYPWLLADAGALDITGAPNGEAFWASSVWTGRTHLAVRPVNENPKKVIKSVWRGTNAIPSWSFRGCEGNAAAAEVYTGAPYAELYLNGKRIGRKKVKDNRAIFKLKYAPGELKTVGCEKDGSSWSGSMTHEETATYHKRAAEGDSHAAAESRDVAVLKSAGTRLRIGLHPEKTTVEPGGLIYVDVTIDDENGICESNFDRKIRLEVQGAKLLGFGSAEPRTEERFDSTEHTTYRGRALVVLQAHNTGCSGSLTAIHAKDVTGDGQEIPAGAVEIHIEDKDGQQ